MKILFFSDLHGDMKALANLKTKSKEADFVGCAGDISNMEANLSQILSGLNSFSKPVLLIPGNHEEETRLGKVCKKFENIIFLHRAVHHYHDYVFLGYGGDGFSSEDPSFTKVADNFFKPETENKRRIILITHGPVYNTSIDMINNENMGNKSYRKFIDEILPHIAVSGHLHENAGKYHKIKRTLFINPGKQGVFVEI